MDKVTSLKKIAGSSATGDTVCEVLESMAGMGDKVGDNAEAIEALETSVAALEAKFPSEKEIILASSTASSTKLFKITVTDNGTITATEYTPPTPPST